MGCADSPTALLALVPLRALSSGQWVALSPIPPFLVAALIIHPSSVQCPMYIAPVLHTWGGLALTMALTASPQRHFLPPSPSPLRGDKARVFSLPSGSTLSGPIVLLLFSPSLPYLAILQHSPFTSRSSPLQGVCLAHAPSSVTPVRWAVAPLKYGELTFYTPVCMSIRV